MNDLTAFVLAGGKSTRMGSDKALLPWGQGTLLSHALKLAEAVAPTRIIGDATKLGAFGVVVEDIYKDRGPLGGIHAALSGSSTEWNLILAVDLPLLQPAFLEYLTEQARQLNVLVTVPVVAGFFHPLTAIYRREFATLAEQALLRGENRIDRLFTTANTRTIPADELAQAGFSEEMFRNVNTPQDFDLVKRIRS